MNHDKKRTVEDTAGIRIQDFRQAANSVRQAGDPICGVLPFLGQDHELMLSNKDGVVELSLDDAIIVLSPQGSPLVPDTVAQWYFRCPECDRRCKYLYRPTLDDEFACRHCHDLTYLSSQEQHKDEALFRAIGKGMGLPGTFVRDLCDYILPDRDKG